MTWGARCASRILIALILCSVQSIREYWTRYGAPGDWTKGPNLSQNFYTEVRAGELFVGTL